MNRRTWLLALTGLPVLRLGRAAETAPVPPPDSALTVTPPVDFAPVLPGRALTFPADHGAHPAFRTEWWYATGWLSLPDGSPLGFQITFFRVRTGLGEQNPSAFAPRQVILAHAAVADPRLGRLRHDQRAARVGFGRAGFETDRTRAWCDDWRFEQTADDRYQATVRGEDFAYALTLQPDGPPLLNGAAGFSTKAPDPRHASYYYSRPQLQVTGTLTLGGRSQTVTGRAWLDHEWSSEYMPEAAQGWDWIGVNLDDGGALMAFRMRRTDGQALWATATLRTADGQTRIIPPTAVVWTPERDWQSPRTGIRYPVDWTLHLETRELHLHALMDDQELDSRGSTGAIYWEGAIRLSENHREIGRGYLEMTGYGDRLQVG